MNEPRKQHYVPQLYLKNFAFGNKTNPKLNILSISPNKLYVANVKDTAAKRDFYTLSNREDKYAWEYYYAQNIEPKFEELLTNILLKCDNVLAQNKDTILGKEEKWELAFNMVIQLLRGQSTRKLGMDVYKRELPFTLEKAENKFSPLSETDKQKIQEFQKTDKYFNEILMRAVLSEDRMKKYTNILIQRNFVFYKIYGGGEFVTSDNPVMFVNAETLEATPFANGMLSPSTLIYYPLSPKVLLVAYHNTFMMNSFNDLDCKLMNLDYNIKRDFVTTNNRLQKDQCGNYVYAHSMEVLNCLNNS